MTSPNFKKNKDNTWIDEVTMAFVSIVEALSPLIMGLASLGVSLQIIELAVASPGQEAGLLNIASLLLGAGLGGSFAAQKSESRTNKRPDEDSQINSVTVQK